MKKTLIISVLLAMSTLAMTSSASEPAPVPTPTTTSTSPSTTEPSADEVMFDDESAMASDVYAEDGCPRRRGYCVIE